MGAEVAESSKGTEAAKESATAMDPAPDNTEATYLQAQTPKGQLKDAPTTEGKDEGAQTHAHAKAHKKLEAYNNEIKNLEQQKQQLLQEAIARNRAERLHNSFREAKHTRNRLHKEIQQLQHANNLDDPARRGLRRVRSPAPSKTGYQHISSYV